MLQALLQANFLSLQPYPPTFACDTMTGDAVLQYTFPILGSTPSELFKVIEDGVRLVLSWRKDFFVDQVLIDDELENYGYITGTTQYPRKAHDGRAATNG
jgi:hypothetical protein